MRTLTAAILCFLFLSLPILAHDYWLKPSDGGAVLVYGHGDESEAYDSARIKQSKAFRSDGRELALKPAVKDGRLVLAATGGSQYMVKVDDGPWAKTVYGWKRGDRGQHKGAIKSSWDLYYAKSQRGAAKPLGLPLEIVIDRSDAKLEGRVLYQGKPLPDVVLQSNHKKVGKTDSEGRFSLPLPKESWSVLRVSHQVKADPALNVDFSQSISTLTWSKS